jgi:hypothetical protein
MRLGFITFLFQVKQEPYGKDAARGGAWQPQGHFHTLKQAGLLVGLPKLLVFASKSNTDF